MEGVELRLADDLRVGVETQVGEQGLQDPDGHRRAVTPVGEIAVLPPPQGLDGATGVVVRQTVCEGGRDDCEVVAQRPAGGLDRGDGPEASRVTRMSKGDSSRAV